MPERLRLVNIFIATIVITLLISVASFGQEPLDLEIKYGTDKTVVVKVLDDFSESGPPDKVWRDGFVEMRDGKIYCEGITIADCYLVEVPKANEHKSMYADAEYIGFEIQNKCDGDIYYCFQGVIDGQDAFTSPEGEKNIVLVDKNGLLHEVEFSETAAIYSRYGFIIPEGFDGYVFIPTERITRLGSWDTSIWHSDVTIEGVGVHVSIGENPYPEVDASYVEFWIDNSLFSVVISLNTKLLKLQCQQHSLLRHQPILQRIRQHHKKQPRLQKSPTTLKLMISFQLFQ